MQWSFNVNLNVNISDIQIPNMRATSKLSYNVLTYLKGHKVVNVVLGTRNWRVSSYRILSSIKEEKRLFNRKYFAARVGIIYVCKFYFPYVSLWYRFWRSIYYFFCVLSHRHVSTLKSLFEFSLKKFRMLPRCFLF